MIGTTVGSYRIVSKLSVGGMGTVYRAEHTLIGKDAAVKVLRPELSHNEDILNRFFNEAKATTAIKHPGIVEVFDYGHLPSGDAYLVMEFLDGMSMAQQCKTGGKMAEGEAAMLLRGVCSALAAAHDKGIVHRDLKPDNIFLVPDADTAIGVRPKVLDFGIAKLTEMGLAGSATKTGAVMGTPTYMSPEQCRGSGVVDHRADLYSLGCILYELLTGRPPFIKLGAGELIGAHLYVAPEPPTTYEPGISVDAEQLIMALLDKDPANRPQTARELHQRLGALAQRQGFTPQAPRGMATPMPMSPLTPPLGLATVDDSRPAGSAETVPSNPSGMSPISHHAAPSARTVSPSILALPLARTQGDPLDKPTTLSGAASQSVIDQLPRTRKGLVMAMATAALLAGGIVAFVQLRGGGDAPVASSAPSNALTPQPSATSSPATVPPSETAAAAEPETTAAGATEAAATDPEPAVKPEPAVTAGSATEVGATQDGVTEDAVGSSVAPTVTTRTVKRPHKPVAASRPTKPEPTKPEPKKPEPKKPEPKKPEPKKPEPKKPTLIETEI